MNILVILTVVVLTAAAESHTIKNPCICKRIYLPVCGTDARTYPNLCTLECIKATRYHDLEMRHKGECKDEPPCSICPNIWAPVCGTDGHTYPSTCQLICVKQQRNSELELAHRGVCKQNPVVKPDEEEIVELEGPERARNSKGNLVSNEEFLDNFRTSKCFCPRIVLFVCGTDGKTYLNDCELQCASRRSNCDLKLAHRGPCQDHRTFPSVLKNTRRYQNEECTCNKMPLPVCGSDGRTYINPCYLRCAKLTNPDLDLVRYGPCL